MKRVVITVDGLAGSGKSALSQALAEKTGFVLLNSGLLYRALGYLVLKEEITSLDDRALKRLFTENRISLSANLTGANVITINEEDVTNQLRVPEVSESASKISAFPIVRELLMPAQQQAFPGQNLIAEGRDMGTVVFPEAQLKFFVTVNEDTRIKRRIAQLYGDTSKFTEKKLNLLKKQVKIEIIERDRRDQERDISPTKPAKDSIMIDNSSQTLTEVVQNMYDAVTNRGLIV